MTEKSTQIRLRKDMIMELRKHKADGESDSDTLRKILNENKRLKEENRNLMEILTNFEKIKEYLQKNQLLKLLRI